MVFWIVFFGYLGFGFLLNYYYYFTKYEDHKNWKINTKTIDRMGKNYEWWMPCGVGEFKYRIIKLSKIKKKLFVSKKKKKKK